MSVWLCVRVHISYIIYLLAIISYPSIRGCDKNKIQLFLVNLQYLLIYMVIHMSYLQVMHVRLPVHARCSSKPPTTLKNRIALSWFCIERGSSDKTPGVTSAMVTESKPGSLLMWSSKCRCIPRKRMWVDVGERKNCSYSHWSILFFPCLTGFVAYNGAVSSNQQLKARPR